MHGDHPPDRRQQPHRHVPAAAVEPRGPLLVVPRPLRRDPKAAVASHLDGDGGRRRRPRGGYVARHLQQRDARPMVLPVVHDQRVRQPRRHQHRRRASGHLEHTNTRPAGHRVTRRHPASPTPPTRSSPPSTRRSPIRRPSEPPPPRATILSSHHSDLGAPSNPTPSADDSPTLRAARASELQLLQNWLAAATARRRAAAATDAALSTAAALSRRRLGGNAGPAPASTPPPSPHPPSRKAWQFS